MRKYILLIVAVLFLFGCAAKKVAVSDTKTKESTDSSVVEKKHNISIIQNSITTIDSSEEFEITPIDTSKPIYIEGKKYVNARVRIVKNRKKTVDSSKTTSEETGSKQTTVKKTKKQNVFDKKLDRKANYTSLWWLLLVPLIGYLVYRLSLYLYKLK
jgi:hypothetical protein